MQATIRELQEILDPPMTRDQIAALIWIHVIPVLGVRDTKAPGRPPSVYSSAAVKQAHWIEANRTRKQFMDKDWMASALLALDLIRADIEAGELRWFNGDRAEQLNAAHYGYVKVGSERVAAHRILWIAAEGEIPYSLQINHINKLRWDNRIANLELVTLGNNVRHRHGAPYVSYGDAVSELAEIRAEPATSAINPYGSSFTGGRLIAGPTTRRPGH